MKNYNVDKKIVSISFAVTLFVLWSKRKIHSTSSQHCVLT